MKLRRRLYSRYVSRLCACVCVENQGGAPASACLLACRPSVRTYNIGLQRVFRDLEGPSDQTPEPGIEHPRPSREIGRSLSSDRVLVEYRTLRTVLRNGIRAEGEAEFGGMATAVSNTDTELRITRREGRGIAYKVVGWKEARGVESLVG